MVVVSFYTASLWTWISSHHSWVCMSEWLIRLRFRHRKTRQSVEIVSPYPENLLENPNPYYRAPETIKVMSISVQRPLAVLVINLTQLEVHGSPVVHRRLSHRRFPRTNKSIQSTLPAPCPAPQQLFIHVLWVYSENNYRSWTERVEAFSSLLSYEKKKNRRTHTEKHDEKRVVTYKFMISIFSVIITTAQHISFCVDVEWVCDSFGCRCLLPSFFASLLFQIIFYFYFVDEAFDLISFRTLLPSTSRRIAVHISRWQSESNIHGSRNYKYIPGFLLRLYSWCAAPFTCPTINIVPYFLSICFSVLVDFSESVQIKVTCVLFPVSITILCCILTLILRLFILSRTANFFWYAIFSSLVSFPSISPNGLRVRMY